MKPWAHGQVVPDGWAGHHRPVIAGFFCDAVTILRKTGEQVTVDDLGTKEDEWVDIATDIPALVQVVHTMQVNPEDSAGHALVVSDYYARLDVEWLPNPGDRLIVTASPDPGNLGTYVVRRRESQGHVVDRTVHLDRVSPDTA